MKNAFLICLLSLAAAGCGTAQQPAPPPPSDAPVPIHAAPPRSAAAPAPSASAAEPFVYDQKPLASQPSLVTQQQAQAVVDKFKAAYPKLGSPRILIYVNRDLVDEK